MTPGGSLCAVIAAHEARRLRRTLRAARVIEWQDLAAVVRAPRPDEDLPRAALAHDRVVARALGVCASVVPFRLGVGFGSDDSARASLDLHAASLRASLGRFEHRVEVGLKVRLGAPNDPVASLPAVVAAVRALAPRVVDRDERVLAAQPFAYLDGRYLIPRAGVEAFWAAVDEQQRETPALSLLGSGPWAPYSFCEGLKRA